LVIYSSYFRHLQPPTRAAPYELIARHGPQVLAVQLEKIEREQDGLRLDARPITQSIKHGDTALVADHDLAVNQAALDFQRHQCLEHGRISVGPAALSPQSCPRR
jgi:hypothetical protein